MSGEGDLSPYYIYIYICQVYTRRYQVNRSIFFVLNENTKTTRCNQQQSSPQSFSGPLEVDKIAWSPPTRSWPHMAASSPYSIYTKPTLGQSSATTVVAVRQKYLLPVSVCTWHQLYSTTNLSTERVCSFVRTKTVKSCDSKRHDLSKTGF